MDITKAKRDPDKIKSHLRNEGDKMITLKPCSIIIPESFTTKGLAIISSKVMIVGIFAMFDESEKFYTVSKATALMTINPSSIETIKLDGRNYIKFGFDAGSEVITNRKLLRNKKLTYNVFNHIIDYGNVPWFFNYVDYAEIFKKSSYWNDLKLGQSQLVWDILIAHITRNPNNVKEYFRHFITDNHQVFAKAFEVPLHDVAATTTSNLARLNGPELQRSIKSALLAVPTRAEPLEQLIIN